MMLHMAVSHHGAKRLRQRAGLKKKSIERAVQIAYEWGKTRDKFEGALARYLFKLEKDSLRLDPRPVTAKVYGNNVYIFGRDEDEWWLITTWPLPPKYRPNKRPPKEWEFPVEELVVE